LELKVAAKYPFLKESARYLRETAVTLDQLVKSLSYERARLAGKERVFEALEDLVVGDHPMIRKEDATIELLSYPVARMIVSTVADPWFVKRYAIAEAKKANERLKNESDAFLMEVASELGLAVAKEDGGFAVGFADFLRFSATMRDKSWKLVNQSIHQGSVIVNKDRLARIVEQMLTEKISSELPLEVNDEVVEAFRPTTEEIRSILEDKRKEMRAEGMGTLSIVRLPPCMKKLLAMIRGGENVPHSGRFALVAFLHTLGMDSQEILKTFSTAPDFDPSKSEYQIRHITGDISGTEYTPPECSTMRSYGICFDPDQLCGDGKIKHPLMYYRVKGRRRRSPK
jgi:DNA primase large subunit